jgi:MYXO-CTERM domain-containing protein
MRKTLITTAIAAALTVVPVTTALATTPPDDPNDVVAIDNPLDENDDSGFDDWGLLGLLGLAGLAGLAGRKRHDNQRHDDVSTYGDRPAGVR